MRQLLSPNQAAKAIGVSEASLKRWCDKGLLPALKTPGGHRRLPVAAVIEFVRRRGGELARPEILGLPPAGRAPKQPTEQMVELMRAALESGDEEECRRLVLGLYLAGREICDICDQIIAPAFHAIGERWQCGELEVYRERRACEVCLRTLHDFRTILPRAKASACLAVGGTLEGDPYTLATTMVEMVLRSCGWRAQSLGAVHPKDTLCKAIREVKPRLFWLSLSTCGDHDHLRQQTDALFSAAGEMGTALVIGGRAMCEPLRRGLRYSAHCETLGHLVCLARTISNNGSGGLPDNAR